jgi:energy-coupling factor transporter ATP-binding protein EcfA2
MTTTTFSLTFPPSLSATGGDTDIKSQGSVVVLGSNGSGKTRLGSWLDLQSPQKDKVHRISAQKSLSMPSVSIPTSVDAARADLIFGYKEGNVAHKTGHRWGGHPNTFLLNDFERLLAYLFSEENDVSIKYRTRAIESGAWTKPEETKLDTIKRIWEQVLPHRELVIGGGKIETKISGATELYNAAEMSDGERVIFYLIGQALSAPADGILIIDEPELHLHKSIQSSLWDKIEAERRDCLFVYLTHAVDFAATRINATKVCLKNFNGTEWDWYVVPHDAEIPEDILLEIAGSRKPVIFVEGDKSSLDYFFYPKLYPNFTIVPAGGCESVIHATGSFSSTKLKSLHHVSSFGLVDRDFRKDDEVTYLKSLGVYVIEFSELENLLLTADVLHSIAEELHRTDFAELFEKAKVLVLDEMERNKERLISCIAAATIERKLKSFDAKATGETDLKTSLDNLTKTIDVTSIYQETQKEVEQILKNRTYDDAIKIYNNKGLTKQISSLFGFKANEFVEFVRRLVASKDGDALLTTMQSKLPQITA